MNRTDIDYIVEKLEFYKPDNIYNGYNSERKKQDQRVSEVLDSIIAEIKSDYENMRTPMPKELVSTCKLDEEQMQKLKKQIELAKMSIEPVKENKWIKCSKQEPPDKTVVLIYDGESIITGYYKKESQIYDLSESEIKDSDLVTHWMPLPEPPEELPNPCEVVKDWEYRTSEESMQALKETLRKAAMSVEGNADDTERIN